MRKIYITPQVFTEKIQTERHFLTGSGEKTVPIGDQEVEEQGAKGNHFCNDGNHSDWDD